MKPKIVFFSILYMIPALKGYTVIDSFINEPTNIIRIPLMRMKSGFQKLVESGVQQYGTDLDIVEKLKATNDTLPLMKYFDSEYYGFINIGKPGKQFKMIFDTVWSHSFVPSVECSSIKLPCAIHNRYDHTRSSTYKADGKVFNISGQFVGYMSRDVFLVGQMNSTDQGFAELSELPWSYSLVHADGIVGLGLQGGSPGYDPLFYNMVTRNHLKNPVFSIYVNRDPTTEHGGSILFGGIDTKHQKGEFTTLDVTSDSYWTFKMSKVTVIINSKKTVEFCANGCTATADTSSNTIVGPPDDIKEINTLIGAEPFIFNRYLIPCTMEYKGPKFNFTMGNKDFQILGRDYVQKLSYSGFTVCLSAFEPASKTSLLVTDWRLGGAFLYQFYTAYDIQNHKFMISAAA